MAQPTIAVIDFETHAICRRPDYPPTPVGVALGEYAGRRKKEYYMAFGHPVENNCTAAEAAAVLERVVAEYDELWFHNAAFDVAVLEEKLRIKVPSRKVRDTMFLCYLDNPRERTALKLAAQRLLGMDPEEQNALREWIIANCYGSLPHTRRDTKKDPWGAHIAEAPGKLVGRYAVGDIVRTKGLRDLLLPRIIANGMWDAFMRELRVMPIFEASSRTGVRVAEKRLKRDIAIWTKEQDSLERQIKRSLHAEELDIASGPQLADAMDRAGKVDQWVYTEPTANFPHGQRSTKRENLIECCNDKQLLYLLARHGILTTYLSTFMRPWYESALQNNGRIYPSFNQIRGESDYGTVTGRPSSTNPNLFNVPKPLDPDEAEEKPWTTGLPNIRHYMVPDEEGDVFLDRDFNQQEVRLLGIFEEGALCAEYKRDPRLEVHDFVGRLMHGNAYNRKQHRKAVKIMNFGIIYGMGAPGVAKRLKISKAEAKELLALHGRALPGAKELMRDIEKAVKAGDPIRTWGGRLYYSEGLVKTKFGFRDLDYKMLNYLIQGSAADITKEAMIRVAAACTGRIVLQVYDEILLNTRAARTYGDMVAMREAMEGLETDIPMLSDGEMSAVSWGRMKAYDPK